MNPNRHRRISPVVLLPVLIGGIVAIAWAGAQTVGGVTFTSGAVAAGSLTLTTDLAVAEGGTGSSTAADARTALSAQTLDAALTDIAGLTLTDGNFIVADGANLVVENGATVRTSLGLGSIATQAANSVTISGGSVSGITDLAVADGGTGSGTASAARTALGVVIGTDVQAWDADLDTLAAGSLPALTVVYEAHTTGDTLTTAETGSHHSNVGAAGLIAIVLPTGGADGVRFVISSVGGNQVDLTPNTADNFAWSGGATAADEVLEVTDGSVTITYDVSATLWVVTGESGTIAEATP